MKSKSLVWIMAGVLIFCLCVSGVSAVAPVAEFSGTPTSGTVPLTVYFTDASTGSPTGWAWFFGDESYTQAWTEQSASAGWTAGSGSDSVVLPDGSIVLVRNGVWRSTDQGISWAQVNPSPGFGDGDTVVMMDGTMLHMNYDGVMPLHSGEVWKSTDKGTTWTPVTMTTNWDSGSQYTNLEDCVALPDGTILLTYYHSMAGEWTALMRSPDQGVTWTTIVLVPWSPRTNFDLTAMPDGNVIMTGGSDWGGNYNDVWMSINKGTTWTQQTANAGWTARYDHTSVAMPDGSIVLMGGYGSSIPGRDEVWRSTNNGATWTLLTASAGWPARMGAASVAMPDGSIVLMGGRSEPAILPYNDAWRFNPIGSSEQGPSHTYSLPGIYQVALQANNTDGYSSIRKANFINGDKAAAIDYGKTYLGLDPPKAVQEELTISDQKADSGAVITLLDGTTHDVNGIDISNTLGKSAWVEYVNLDKDANYGHLGKIIFYADDTTHQDYDVMMPPTGIAFSHAAGYVPDPVGVTQKGAPYDNDPACTPVTTNNYALLISGGGTKDTNYARYYNDIQFMYKTLVNDYKYDKTHIKVLLSDGLMGTGKEDQVTGYTTATPPVAIYADSNLDLDGVIGSEVSGAATRTNVINALKSFNAGTPAAPIDLLIFTTGHGAANQLYSDPSTNQVDLLLWGVGEKISDTEFGYNLPANARISMMMEQCNGGGFKNEFIPASGLTRVLATAAQGNQASHSNDFSYYWITGVAGHDSVPFPNTHYTNADADGNFQVSMYEAYYYANKADPSGPTFGKVETPTFNQYAASAGASQFFSTCTNDYSIGVATPTTALNGGSPYTITWTTPKPFPTGTNIKIDLLKGPEPGWYQVPIIDTRAVAFKSYVWSVPTSLNGDDGTDYWIRISTIGSFRPITIGRSNNFAISNVGKAGTADLTIQSTPPDLPIVLKDANGNTALDKDGATTAGFRTVSPNGHTFSLFGGIYYVSLSKPCYQPLDSAKVTLVSGNSQTKSYPLLAMKQGTCENTLSGSIEIISEPQEGFRVFIDGTNMQYDTPVFQDIDSGVHTVRLELSGYVPQEKTDVLVEPGKRTRVLFTLERTADNLYTFTGFDAPVDMSPVVNSANAGRNIPLKWHLSDGNGYVSNSGRFKLVFDTVSCPGGGLSDEIEVYDTSTTDSGLTYQGNGAWHYNWKTVKGFKGCKNVYLEFKNGQPSPVANFKFK